MDSLSEDKTSVRTRIHQKTRRIVAIQTRPEYEIYVNPSALSGTQNLTATSRDKFLLVNAHETKEIPMAIPDVVSRI